MILKSNHNEFLLIEGHNSLGSIYTNRKLINRNSRKSKLLQEMKTIKAGPNQEVILTIKQEVKDSRRLKAKSKT